jgi:Nucleoside 2-deoxyribosyltransferase
MRCYPASKARWGPTVWKPLRAALAPLGVDLSARWLDWDLQDSPEKSPEQWRHHWQENIVPDVLACDVLLFMSLASERSCSALIEAGIAIAHAKPVLCVSPDWWSFSHLPNVRRFTDLAPAIETLIAMAAGERARAA